MIYTDTARSSYAYTTCYSKLHETLYLETLAHSALIPQAGGMKQNGSPLKLLFRIALNLKNIFDYSC